MYKAHACNKSKSRYFQSRFSRGSSIMEKKQLLNLNLSEGEYLTAVGNQPKPLIIPLCAEMPLPPISPLAVFKGTRKGCGFLLESMEGSEKIARYSFVGIDPECVITVGTSVDVRGREPFVSIANDPKGDNPVDTMKEILSRFHYVNINAPRFFGGMVGYFAYDCVFSLFRDARGTQAIGKKNSDNPGTDARFMLTKDCIVFDHLDKKLFIFSSPFLTYDSDPVEEYRQSVKKIAYLSSHIASLSVSHATESPRQCSPAIVPQFSYSIPQHVFEQSVNRVKEHIAAGDIFQAVLSRKLECTFDQDSFDVYAALREINPSPYMYYLDFGDETVIGASPEMLVRVEKRRITTVPIAGTRSRAASPEEDERLAEDLLSDPKERAEHTMLVDLARNDVGRVCRFGSVEVSEFMAIEKFSHVQHIVSTVTGVLRDNLDCYDAFKSCFPAGTVSGAPKIRAMQIIDDEEPARRGLYAGAVGYIGFDKNLEFAIAIRTVIIRGKTASVQVGAGIVADSVPAREWEETASKSAAMLRAIEKAGVYPCGS